MPLIKPEVQKNLRALGLADGPDEQEGTISDKLNRAGLSTEDIASELSHIARNSANETLRLRALETAMKAHGVLKDSASVQVPSFNVIIQQVDGSGALEANKILFPRQSLGLVSPIIKVEEKEQVN